MTLTPEAEETFIFFLVSDYLVSLDKVLVVYVYVSAVPQNPLWDVSPPVMVISHVFAS